MQYHPARFAARRARWSVVAHALLAACVGDPVDWTGDPASVPPPPSADARFALDASGRPTYLPPIVPPTVPADAAMCRASLRVAEATPTELHAVWWHYRADGSASLLASRSEDGGRTWEASAPIDTVDRGTTACERPAPAVAADARTGYVHVAYSLLAPEGPGIFFSHSMDRGALFHSPVVIAYGERPSRVSVAAAGDTVVVAYEDPNAARPEIGAALSRTMGHIFEDRFDIGGSGIGSVDPLVALRGSTIAVVWRTAEQGDTFASPTVVGGTVATGDPRAIPAAAAQQRSTYYASVGKLR
jgi:hypothetical protein